MNESIVHYKFYSQINLLKCHALIALFSIDKTKYSFMFDHDAVYFLLSLIKIFFYLSTESKSEQKIILIIQASRK